MRGPSDVVQHIVLRVAYGRTIFKIVVLWLEVRGLTQVVQALVTPARSP
jgi:hypothetical protein